MRKRKPQDQQDRYRQQGKPENKLDGATFGEFKKARSELVDEANGDPLCIFFNTSSCHSKIGAGGKCKRANKEYAHLCAARKNKSDPKSPACAMAHPAKEHK